MLAGHTNVVELLLARGADVTDRVLLGHHDGVTPLYRAAGLGLKDRVELLLARGATSTPKTPMARRPCTSPFPRYLCTLTFISNQ